MHEPRPGFERVVSADYERTHPGYSPEAVGWMDSQVSLQARPVVDLAAGTGKLTRLLTRMSGTVFAIEPAGNMLSVLKEVVPSAHPIRGTAENLPIADGSARCVTVGGSFHLFDIDRAAREIHRVLQPDGALAIFWKRYDMRHPIQQALDKIVAPYLKGQGWAIHHADPSWPDRLLRTALFAQAEERSFVHDQDTAAADLATILLTATDVAWLPSNRRRDVVLRVNEFASELPQRITLPGATHVFLYSRNPPGTAR